MKSRSALAALLIVALAAGLSCGRKSKFEDTSEDDKATGTGPTQIVNHNAPATNQSSQAAGIGATAENNSSEGPSDQKLVELLQSCPFFIAGTDLTQNEQYKKYYRPRNGNSVVNDSEIYYALPTPFHESSRRFQYNGVWDASFRHFSFEVHIGKPLSGNADWKFPYVAGQQGSTDTVYEHTNLDNFVYHMYLGRVTICDQAGACKLEMTLKAKGGDVFADRNLPAAGMTICQTQ